MPDSKHPNSCYSFPNKFALYLHIIANEPAKPRREAGKAAAL